MLVACFLSHKLSTLWSVFPLSLNTPSVLRNKENWWGSKTQNQTGTGMALQCGLLQHCSTIADLCWRGQTLFLSSTWGHLGQCLWKLCLWYALAHFYRQISQGWRKGVRLRYGQLRRTHLSAIRSFRKIILHLNKILSRLKRPGSVAQMPVHTNSLHQGQLTRRW